MCASSAVHLETISITALIARVGVRTVLYNLVSRVRVGVHMWTTLMAANNSDGAGASLTPLAVV